MLSNTAIEGRAGKRDDATARLGALDAARGAAVIAMVVYHTSWDLSELRLIAVSVVGDPGWNAFARAIASSFLLLVGFGLALAHADGVRWRQLIRRAVTISLAALSVTIATWIVFPTSYVFFGVLHAIAASSLLAVPFLRAPLMLTAAATVAVGASSQLASPLFDAPALAFLGLGTRVPLTNDYVPLVPWFGFVLAGIALGRAGTPGRWLSRFGPRSPAGRLLAWLGRHSLVIYLAHQPLIYGGLSGFAAIAGPFPAAEATLFMRECAARCVAGGQTEEICRIACRCTLVDLREGPLWRAMMDGRLSVTDRGRVGDVARSCRTRAR